MKYVTELFRVFHLCGTGIIVPNLDAITHSDKFDVLIEIASVMNDLHFSANTQIDIIVDFIAKKEIKDNNLKDVLLKTIVKQYNNRVVVSASMDN